MKRRDTIIVAVLVNVSLLIVLFITATKPNGKKRLIESLPATLASQEGLHAPQVFDVDPKIPLTHNNLLQQFAETAPIVLPEVSYQDKNSEIDENKTIQSLPNQVLVEKPQDKVISPHVVPSEDFINVIVKKGDFLEKIAKANNTTVATLIKINQLTTTQLKIGQVLKVPSSNQSNVEEVKTLNDQEEFYIVKEGDSPWIIALRHKMKLEDLLQLNDLDEYKARRLKPGDQLRIR